MTEQDDVRLNNLFENYRAACPDVEPGANFMPNVWNKIEARRSFRWVFERMARTVVTVSAAICLLLLVLNFATSSQAYLLAPTYMDALMADHTVEKVYYTEAIRSTPVPDVVPDGFAQ